MPLDCSEGCVSVQLLCWKRGNEHKAAQVRWDNSSVWWDDTRGGVCSLSGAWGNSTGAWRIVRRWTGRQLFASLGLCAVGASWGTPTWAADRLVMSFACEVRSGRVQISPSSDQTFVIISLHEQEPVTACAPAEPHRCRTWMVHKFDLNCSGTRVSWFAVAAAVVAQRPWRGWLSDGRLHLRTGLRTARDGVTKCASIVRAGLPATLERRRPLAAHCSRYHALRTGEFVALPRGYAPMMGASVRFTSSTPPPVATSSTAPIWATTAAASEAPGRIGAVDIVETDGIISKSGDTTALPEARAGDHEGSDKIQEAGPTSEPMVVDVRPPPAAVAPLAAAGSADNLTATAEIAIAKDGSSSTTGAAIVSVQDTLAQKEMAGVRPAKRRPDRTPAWLGLGLFLASLGLLLVLRTRQRQNVAALTAASATSQAATTGTAGGLDGANGGGSDPNSETGAAPAAAVAAMIYSADTLHAAVREQVLLLDRPLVQAKLLEALALVERRLLSQQLTDHVAAREWGQAQSTITEVLFDLGKLQTTLDAANEPAHVPREQGRVLDRAIMPANASEAFALLGVNPDADEKIVKKVVDGLRQSWHPDLARDEDDRLRREQRMKGINVAWELIRCRRQEAA